MPNATPTTRSGNGVSRHRRVARVHADTSSPLPKMQIWRYVILSSFDPLYHFRGAFSSVTCTRMISLILESRRYHCDEHSRFHRSLIILESRKTVPSLLMKVILHCVAYSDYCNVPETWLSDISDAICKYTAIYGYRTNNGADVANNDWYVTSKASNTSYLFAVQL